MYKFQILILNFLKQIFAIFFYFYAKYTQPCLQSIPLYPLSHPLKQEPLI